jgi:hypothetical protein
MPDGCPKGTPEDQKTLTAENAEAYWHWQQCKAVGQFPNDEIVMRNAGIIQQEVDRLERERHENLMLMLSIPRG